MTIRCVLSPSTAKVTTATSPVPGSSGAEHNDQNTMVTFNNCQHQQRKKSHLGVYQQQGKYSASEMMYGLVHRGNGPASSALPSYVPRNSICIVPSNHRNWTTESQDSSAFADDVSSITSYGSVRPLRNYDPLKDSKDQSNTTLHAAADPPEEIFVRTLRARRRKTIVGISSNVVQHSEENYVNCRMVQQTSAVVMQTSKSKSIDENMIRSKMADSSSPAILSWSPPQVSAIRTSNCFANNDNSFGSPVTTQAMRSARIQLLSPSSSRQLSSVGSPQVIQKIQSFASEEASSTSTLLTPTQMQSPSPDTTVLSPTIHGDFIAATKHSRPQQESKRTNNKQRKGMIRREFGRRMASIRFNGRKNIKHVDQKDTATDVTNKISSTNKINHDIKGDDIDRAFGIVDVVATTSTDTFEGGSSISSNMAPLKSTKNNNRKKMKSKRRLFASKHDLIDQYDESSWNKNHFQRLML